MLTRRCALLLLLLWQAAVCSSALSMEEAELASPVYHRELDVADGGEEVADDDDAVDDIVGTNATRAEDAPQKGNRTGRQFWPLFPGGDLAYFSPPQAPLFAPLMPQQPLVSSGTSKQQSSSDSDSAESRVGDTLAPFKFPSATTPADEKVIVESVNHLIGAVGRQALNGVQIYSDDSDEDDAAVVEPGRPGPPPVVAPVASGGGSAPSSGAVAAAANECCLFVFFDGSAFFFDDYLRTLTGHYRLMYGTVNGHPHFVARGCKEAELYGPNCSYIWNSGFGWIIGIGTYIGQTKGVVYTRSEGGCPTDASARWRYLNKELEWQDNGNIVVKCAS